MNEKLNKFTYIKMESPVHKNHHMLSQKTSTKARKNICNSQTKRLTPQLVSTENPKRKPTEGRGVSKVEITLLTIGGDATGGGQGSSPPGHPRATWALQTPPPGRGLLSASDIPTPCVLPPLEQGPLRYPQWKVLVPDNMQHRAASSPLTSPSSCSRPEPSFLGCC